MANSLHAAVSSVHDRRMSWHTGREGPEHRWAAKDAAGELKWAGIDGEGTFRGSDQRRAARCSLVGQAAGVPDSTFVRIVAGERAVIVVVAASVVRALENGALMADTRPGRFGRLSQRGHNEREHTCRLGTARVWFLVAQRKNLVAPVSGQRRGAPG